MAQGAGEGVSLEQRGPRYLVLHGQPWESEEIIFFCDWTDLAAGSCWERPGEQGWEQQDVSPAGWGGKGWGEGILWSLCNLLRAFYLLKKINKN